MPDLNIVSSRPAIVWVPPQEIDERLDAYPFDVRFIQPLQRLNAVDYEIKPLHTITRTIRCGPFGSSVLAETYVDYGIPLLRPVNLAFGIMDFSDIVSVSPKAAEEGGYPIFGPGTVLFARVGNVNVGVLPEHAKQAALGPNVIGAEIKQNVDPFFVGIFAASCYGLVQLERKLKVVAQPTITTGTVRDFLVPLPPRPVQTYIGDKVRLAERCRIQARELRLSIRELLKQYTGLSTIEGVMNNTQRQVAHYINPVDIDDRMDAEFYQGIHFEVEQLIRAGSWVRLNRLVKTPIKGVQPEYDPQGSVPAVTVTNIDPNEIDTASAQTVSYTWAKSNPRAWVEPGEVLITVTGPPLGECAVVQKFHCPLIINSHVARLRLKTDFTYPYYLAAVLNSEIGASQVYRHCKGVRQKELYFDDLLNFLIPEVELEIVKQIDQLGYQSDQLNENARSLVAEAKADVEALIEGRLDVEGIVAGRVVAPTWEEITAQAAP